MKKLNIFWILVDSARNFRAGIDDRDLPEEVDSFGRKYVYFKNVVTSAPSTLMAVSSIMGSIPSCLIGRNYNNFPDISDTFLNFPTILRQNGYRVRGALYYRHARETCKMLGEMDKRFMPPEITYRMRLWSNETVYRMFENIMKEEAPEPLFCYLHYNVRHDDKISEVVSKTLALIENRGCLENSIVLIDSDHGYPLPSRGWAADQQDAALPHDLLLYNDNLLTPLALYYPGCPRGTVVEKNVWCLDLVPTLLDILGSEIKYRGAFWGKTLLPYLADPGFNYERIIRCDNRFMAQPHRGTAIFKNDLKLIANYFPDRTYYEFYDLTADPEEKNNLSERGESAADFAMLRKELEKSEDETFRFHYNFLLERWKKGCESRVAVDKKYKISLVVDDEPLYEKLFVNAFMSLFPNAAFTVQSRSREPVPAKEAARLIPAAAAPAKYDLLIGAINIELPWMNIPVVKKYRRIPAKRYLFADNNGVMLGRGAIAAMTWKYVRKRLGAGLREPQMLFELFSLIVSRKTPQDSLSRAAETLVGGKDKD